MVDLVRLIDVAEEMAIAHSNRSMGDGAWELSRKEVSAFADYLSRYRQFVKKLNAHKKTVKARHASAQLVSAGAKSIDPYPHPGEEPEKPERLTEFLNAIELAEAEDLDTSRLAILDSIKNGSLKAVVDVGGGMIERLDRAQAFPMQPYAHMQGGILVGPDPLILPNQKRPTTIWPWYGFGKNNGRFPLCISREDFESWMELSQESQVLEATTPASESVTTYVTGAPGRPTSMHLIESELERRAAAGEIETSSIAAECRVLAAWVKAKHPDAQPVTAKTIQNRLSAKIRKYQAAQKTS